MVDQKEQHYYHISSIDKVQENRATEGWYVPKKIYFGSHLEKNIFNICAEDALFGSNLQI